MNSTPQKILIIKVGRIGDMVMLTPALQRIAELYPSARKDLMTGPDGKRMTPFLPVKFERVFIHSRRTIYFFRRLKLRRELAAERYDLILCFETNPGYRQFLAGLSERMFFPENLPGLHYSDLLLRMTHHSAGIEPAQTGRESFPARIHVSPERETATAEFLKTLGITPEMLLIGFHPSFSGIHKPHKYIKRYRHKVWAAENYAELAVRLAAELKKRNIPHRIVMNVVPAERKIAENIARLSGGAAEVLDLPAGFESYLCYLKRLNLFIGPDTGPMHLSAALGVQVIALFSGEDPEQCGPFVPYEQFTAVRAENCAHPEKGLNALSAGHIFYCTKFILTPVIYN
ncbi:hypothetical protein CHS0354_018418 [Potamilus streckersoni]|uniref:Uncharacterized protein n=1 Tax=Potamilus streckersoni TaxID=2493646 RepID=A0AAE0WA82_9BIVA|nr:hypothetical protein CHS0354_018418 [Potamilus streckersoni]